MSVLYKFLFPMKPDGMAVSLFLLALRLLFGGLLLMHGMQKLTNFSDMSSTFPDPLGVGHVTSLGLAIFAEVACSIGFMLGALYRLALIPMIFTMCIAVFVIHGHDPFALKELPFVYLSVFVLMFLIGPGKLSLDRLVAIPLSKK